MLLDDGTKIFGFTVFVGIFGLLATYLFVMMLFSDNEFPLEGKVSSKCTKKKKKKKKEENMKLSQKKD